MTNSFRGNFAGYKGKDVPRDVETAVKIDKNFDPFEKRQVPHPTTDCETLIHFLKASLGTGILAMPVAFKSTGLLMGIISTLLVGFVVTHCSKILVNCAHVFYYKTQRSQMSFAEVAEISCSYGPKWAQSFSKPLRHTVNISLFITYYGTCTVYAVIVAANFQQVLNHHLGYEMNLRLLILLLLIPFVLISWVPDLKYLAPVSMIANVFLGSGLGITFYYLIKGISLTDMKERPLIGSISEFPNFFGITIFGMAGIGIVMPLENDMKTPRHFLGICGVLNKGMSIVTMIFVSLGFLGYARYGDKTCDSITLNLPIKEAPARIVKVLIGLAVFCTFTLQFYVCLDIAWAGIKERFQKTPLVANYMLRTVLVSSSVLLAVAFPMISPFISLIGALFLSTANFLIPVFIETVTYWDIGFGRFHWVVMKNFIICIIGLMAVVFGSSSAIKDIIGTFTGSTESQCGAA